MCVYISKRKKDNRTVVANETTDMFMSVRQKKTRTKLCKKIIQEKKESGKYILQGYIIRKKRQKRNFSHN